MTNRIQQHSKIILISVLAVSLALLLTLALPAAPVRAQSITVAFTSLSEPTAIMVTGKDFLNYRNQYVYIYFHDSLVKSILVSQDGSFTTEFEISGEKTSDYIIIRNLRHQELTIAPLFPTEIPRILPDTTEAKAGQWVELDSLRFDANQIVHFYFSSNNVTIGSNIDSDVVAYKNLGTTRTGNDGKLETTFLFQIPGRLTDGTNQADVSGGVYYLYATYFPGDKDIVASHKFLVLAGEITPSPAKSQTGTEVELDGKGFHASQKITTKYDGTAIVASSGNNETDSDGKFSGTIIIPESTSGKHVITVTDESGENGESEFTVEPGINIDPTSATANKTVSIRGTGFAGSSSINITLNSDMVFTAPGLIETDLNGSFSGRFIVPDYPSYIDAGPVSIAASDASFNSAEAVLMIQAIPAGISLSPATSRASPGYVGMELTIEGNRFRPATRVTVTYDDTLALIAATTSIGGYGNFTATFAIPNSPAGAHVITADDGTNTATATFTMEAEAPPTPVPQLPTVVITPEAKAHFAWNEVEDISGVTYSLQIVVDMNFNDIVLEKKGLTEPEYNLTETEVEIRSSSKETPLYWRVKAVDGAFNESEWTPRGVFYVGLNWTSTPAPAATGIWILGVSIGVAILGLLLLISGMRKPKTPPAE